MEDQEILHQAIEKLETQRHNLGNLAVDAAIEGINRKLQELKGSGNQVYPRAQKIEHHRERRVVTVLFCDVTGSTALAESMDPEEWTGIMNKIFEYLIEPVERYGGTIARLMGDAILAFFGAPAAHEDDPQRAILSGLAIIENIAPFRKQLLAEHGREFNVRVGINTGLAVVGDVGSDTAGEYTAMGDAVNLAARMEQTAAPGTVQISHDTYALVAPLFDFKPLGGISVKGKSDPVLAYKVLGRKTSPGSLRGHAAQGLSSPLVGRESELEAAKAAFERLAAGQGGILAILGEAGIGKSRLISELRVASSGPDDHMKTTSSPILWLAGQTLSYGQTISYWSFQQVFRDYAGISEEDSELVVLDKLEESIQQLFGEETIEILPYLASLLSIEVRGEYARRVEYLDGEALGRQVYRATYRFIQRLASQSPLVLLFDDLHWMDASSASLLEHLFPLVEQLPLLICVLSRPDHAAPAAKLTENATHQFASHLTVIDLVPLSLEDSQHLAQNLLEIEGFPEKSRQMILEKADGNPFYLEEILHDLIEDGYLSRDPATGRYRVSRNISQVHVPDTIQGLLITRIDRLDERLKHVVRRAAVIGRTFLYRILNAIVDDDQELEQELDELQNIDLIQEVKRLPELEYIFKHALAQEAAYEGILLAERREVHRRVAAAIEYLMADRLDEFYGLLAYHYSAAEDWKQAQEYLFKAGDQAGRIAADVEALALYRQAIEAYSRVRGDDWQPLERATLERKIGVAFFRLGDFSQARTYLESSLSYLGVDLPTSRLGVRFAIARSLLIQAFHRFFPSRFVRPMSDSPNPVSEELFNAANALGWIEGVSDVERFFLITIIILNASERRGFAYGSAYLASSMATALEFIGWKRLVNRYINLAREYAQNIDPQRPIYQLDWGLALHHNVNAEWDNSLQYAQKAAEIAIYSGDLRSWGSGMDLTSWAYMSLGKLAQAHKISREMINVAQEGSDLQVLCWGLLGLGVTKKRQGRIDEAISDLTRAIEISEKVPDFHTQVAASGWLGRCYAASGELELALEILESSQEVLSTQGVVIEKAILGNGFSETYLAYAERSSGRDRQAWMKKAKVSCSYSLKAARIYRPPLADAMMFQGRYEWLKGNASGAQKWWTKALEETRQKGDRYEQGIVHMEIGNRLGDRSHLEQAESLLDELGAEFDLVLTRNSLKKLRRSQLT
jgi:class 3 adenylate cyclase/tetratricopeptide (TPR) repeat protein